MWRGGGALLVSSCLLPAEIAIPTLMCVICQDSSESFADIEVSCWQQMLQANQLDSRCNLLLEIPNLRAH